jgi:hypothetical protein
MLHHVSCLKRIRRCCATAVVIAAAALPNLIDQLVKLYGLRQPLLSRHTSEVLAALAGSSSSHINPQQLQQLLSLLIDGEASTLLAGEPVIYVLTV